MTQERPVGEVFCVNGLEYVVVPDAEGVVGCGFCVFGGYCGFPPSILSEYGECSSRVRKDGVDVHFERFNDGRHLTRHLHEGKKSPIATDREQ